jgi:hypothetical protein
MFENISLSDSDDNDSLETELQGLKSSELLIQSQLEQVGDAESQLEAQHVMMMTQDDLYLQQHDQLPLVDEYKADRRITSSGKSTFRPDPPAQEQRPLVGLEDPDNYDDDDDDGEREACRSQLPNVEELMARPRVVTDPMDPLTEEERRVRISQLPSARELRRKLRAEKSRKQKRRLRLGIMLGILVLLIVFAIILPVLLIEEKEASRKDKVVYFLVDNRISMLGDLETPGSPQNKAAAWIADQDKLRVPISMGRSFLDRYTLAVLFFALGGDETWPDNLNFLSPDHVCQWMKQYETPLRNDLTAGVHGCQKIDGELVPVGIALGKYSNSWELSF